MNANEVIANRAIELLGGKRRLFARSSNDHVNCGQSTNDITPACVKNDAVCGLRKPAGRAGRVDRGPFSERAKAFDGVVKMGTQLRDAVRIRLGRNLRRMPRSCAGSASGWPAGVGDAGSQPLAVQPWARASTPTRAYRTGGFTLLAELTGIPLHPKP